MADRSSRISRSSISGADRASRSSISAFISSGPPTPIKAIVSTIKAVKAGTYAPEFDPSTKYKTDVQIESILHGRKEVRIRKVYLLSSVYKVGWVVDKDINQCMVCNAEFGWTTYRHHCRSCGSLVCSKCSPYKAKLQNLEEEGGSRVCLNCFGLRTDIYAAPIRTAKNDTPTKIMAEQSVAGGPSNIFSPHESRVRRNSQKFFDSEAQGEPGNPAEGRQRRNSAYSTSLDELEKDLDISYEHCYRTMRQLVPPNIFKTNLQFMLDKGLPEAVATRIWNTKVLWILCMHVDDITKIHIADLRGKYQAHGLDIVEMRALWYMLKQTDWMNDQSVAKAEWKLGFKSKLDDLAHREAYGRLSEAETRHPAYEGCDDLSVFDPDEAIHKRYDRSASYYTDAVASPAVAEAPGPASSSFLDESPQDSFTDIAARAAARSVAGGGGGIAASARRVEFSAEKDLMHDDSVSAVSFDDYSTDMDSSIISPSDPRMRKLFGSVDSKVSSIGGPSPVPATGASRQSFGLSTGGGPGTANGRNSMGKPPLSVDRSRYNVDQDPAASIRKTTLKNIFDEEVTQQQQQAVPVGQLQTPAGYTAQHPEEDLGLTSAAKPRMAPPSHRIVYTPGDRLKSGGGHQDSGTAGTNESDPWSMKWNTPNSPITPAQPYFTAAQSKGRGNAANWSDSDASVVSLDRSIDAEGSLWWAPTIADGEISMEDEERAVTPRFVSPSTGGASAAQGVNSGSASTSGDCLDEANSEDAKFTRPILEKSRSVDQMESGSEKKSAGLQGLIKSRSSDRLDAGQPVVVSRPISYSGKSSSASRESKWESGSAADDASSAAGSVSSSGRFRRRSTTSTRVPFSSPGGSSPGGGTGPGGIRRSSSYRSAGGSRGGSFSSVNSDISSLSNSPSKPRSAERLIGIFLAHLAAGEATQAKQLFQSAQADAQTGIGNACPRITCGEATALLLKCADNPETLAEPLETFSLLVDEFSANVNATDATGRNTLQMVFTDEMLGKFLIVKGADVLSEDDAGNCALSTAFEFGQDWVQEMFEKCGAEKTLLSSGDESRVRKYVSCLILGGLASKAAEIIESSGVKLSAAAATELFAACKGNFDNMKEAVETFELLEKLGADIS